MLTVAKRRAVPPCQTRTVPPRSAQNSRPSGAKASAVAKAALSVADGGDWPATAHEATLLLLLLLLPAPLLDAAGEVLAGVDPGGAGVADGDAVEVAGRPRVGLDAGSALLDGVEPQAPTANAQSVIAASSRQPRPATAMLAE